MTGFSGENRLINYRPLFEFALGMMAGILLCAELPFWAALAAAALSALGCALLFYRRLHRHAVFALAVLIGLFLAVIALPTVFTPGKCDLNGVVVEAEVRDGDTVLTLERVTLNGASFNKRARLTVNDGSSANAYRFKIGDLITAEASIRMPDRRFSTYDERTAMLANGVGCIASASQVLVTGEHALPFAEFIDSLRNAAESRIKLAFGEDHAIFSTVLLGIRGELSSERAEAYRASGTAHLLAISGFHMGIIAGAVSRLISKRRRILKLAVVSAVAAAYCTVAAYTPGIVRAAIMTACLLASGALGRRPDTLSSLSLASILILAFNPYQLYSVGFRFSFSAVFGIALFSGSLSRAANSVRIPKKLASAAAVCIAATIGTLMLQLRYYSAFTPYSVIANLIAVPAFSAVVMLGAAAVIIAFIFPAAAQYFAILPRSVLFVTEKLLGAVSKLPLASIEFKPPSSAACLIYLVLIFILSEYVLRPKRKRLEFAVPLIILFTFAYVLGIIVS
ncbi:MAG: ComEC/Rec2 family competence protein [Clostridia bacterium]|nr:ComEC/Rec2 family competence protein [Clostridia bacterium]